jgi:hypothetical protein
MHKVTATLGCFLMAGAVFAQQTPPAASSSAKTSAAADQASTAPAHPLTDVQAHEMLKITGADKIKPELTQGLTNYFHTSLPFAPKDVNDDLDQSLTKLDVETQVIAIYKQHISTEEAESIIAFYKTPAGKHMIDALPEILPSPSGDRSCREAVPGRACAAIRAIAEYSILTWHGTRSETSHTSSAAPVTLIQMSRASGPASAFP